MSRNGKDKFYKQLKIDNETRQLIRMFRKLKKAMMSKDYARKNNARRN